jgi:hypothetical protein
MLLSEKIVNTDKYGGTVDLISGIEDFRSTCTYNEEWHTYRVNGEIVPSVTQLLKDNSYDNVDKKILEKAAKRGTLIHKEIEDFIKHNKNGYTDEFLDFRDIYTKNIELFQKQAIFDIKTYMYASQANRKKCYNQIKLYAEAIKYLTGIEIKQFYMIHLPKNRKARLIDLTKEFGNE